MIFSHYRFIIFLLTVFWLFGFTEKNSIDNCYISFNGTKNLIAQKPDRLSETSEKTRTVTTDKGEVEISRIDGYRVLYNNSKNVPFVNLKVELSNEKAFATDTIKLLENLKYSNSQSSGMETKDLISIEKNGYKMYGLGRDNIETGSTLGIFIMFLKDNVIVYFYFNNLKHEVRNFNSLEDYKLQRDNFFEEYTKHLNTCMNK